MMGVHNPGHAMRTLPACLAFEASTQLRSTHIEKIERVGISYKGTH